MFIVITISCCVVTGCLLGPPGRMLRSRVGGGKRLPDKEIGQKGLPCREIGQKGLPCKVINQKGLGALERVGTLEMVEGYRQLRLVERRREESEATIREQGELFRLTHHQSNTRFRARYTTTQHNTTQHNKTQHTHTHTETIHTTIVQ